MSVSYSTYVGPIVQCSVSKTMDARDIIGCGNGDCNEFKKEVFESKKKFCSECGGGLEKITIEFEVDTVNSSDVFKNDAMTLRTEECLMMYKELPCLHIWTPNRGDKRGGKTYSSHEAMMLNIKEIPVADETSAFEEDYAEELAFIREQYGNDNVSVYYGMIHYGN